MRSKVNYSKSFVESCRLDRELEVLTKDRKFDRERAKLSSQSPIKKMISQANKDLEKIEQEINRLTNDITESDQEYLYETTPKTTRERTQYFKNTEPVEAEIIRSSIKAAIKKKKVPDYIYQSSDLSTASQNNMNIKTSVSGSDFSRTSSTLSLSDLEPSNPTNQKDEARRTKMLRLANTTKTYTAQELRSLAPQQTELSLQELHSKSMRKPKRHGRTIDDFNSKATRERTFRKSYVEPDPGRIKEIKEKFVLSYDPMLKITYKQCATNLCEDCDELIAKLSQ